MHGATGSYADLYPGADALYEISQQCANSTEEMRLLENEFRNSVHLCKNESCRPGRNFLDKMKNMFNFIDERLVRLKSMETACINSHDHLENRIAIASRTNDNLYAKYSKQSKNLNASDKLKTLHEQSRCLEEQTKRQLPLQTTIETEIQSMVEEMSCVSKYVLLISEQIERLKSKVCNCSAKMAEKQQIQLNETDKSNKTRAVLMQQVKELQTVQEEYDKELEISDILLQQTKNNSNGMYEKMCKMREPVKQKAEKRNILSQKIIDTERLVAESEETERISSEKVMQQEEEIKMLTECMERSRNFVQDTNSEIDAITANVKTKFDEFVITSGNIWGEVHMLETEFDQHKAAVDCTLSEIELDDMLNHIRETIPYQEKEESEIGNESREYAETIKALEAQCETEKNRSRNLQIDRNTRKRIEKASENAKNEKRIKRSENENIPKVLTKVNTMNKIESKSELLTVTLKREKSIIKNSSLEKRKILPWLDDSADTIPCFADDPPEPVKMRKSSKKKNNVLTKSSAMINNENNSPNHKLGYIEDTCAYVSATVTANDESKAYLSDSSQDTDDSRLAMILDSL